MGTTSDSIRVPPIRVGKVELHSPNCIWRNWWSELVELGFAFFGIIFSRKFPNFQFGFCTSSQTDIPISSRDPFVVLSVEKGEWPVLQEDLRKWRSNNNANKPSAFRNCSRSNSDLNQFVPQKWPFLLRSPFGLLFQDMNVLTDSIQKLQMIQQHFLASQENSKQMEKMPEGSDCLVPLCDGVTTTASFNTHQLRIIICDTLQLLVRGKALDVKTNLVDIGAGYFVEMVRFLEEIETFFCFTIFFGSFRLRRKVGTTANVAWIF
jgi:prefoldin subunit 5